MMRKVFFMRKKTLRIFLPLWAPKSASDVAAEEISSDNPTIHGQSP